MIPADNGSRYVYINGKLTDSYTENTKTDFEREGATRIYEVVHVTGGMPVFLKGHYNRLKNSSRMTGVKGIPSYEELSDEVRSLIKLNEKSDCDFKLICTENNSGGCDRILYFNIYKSSEKCTVSKEEGIEASVFEWERINPNAKVGRNDYIAAVNEFKKTHPESFELILKNRNGKLTEGSMSNFYAIKGNTVYTAPKKEVLEGIMRIHVLEICRNAGIKICFRAPSEFDVKNNFDAAFISSTPVNILPIRSIDGTALGSLTNSVMLKILKEFDIMIKNQND